MPFRRVTPVLHPRVRNLCVRPYEGHPKGCPNHGHKAGCPPQAPLLSEVLDLSRPVWAVWTIFDLAGHVERMRAAHPGWSWRQLTCCLYWQAGARRRLRIVAEQELLHERTDLLLLTCPEACGVNVTATMASIGERLQWPPETVTYQVALVGWPKPAPDLKRMPRAGEQLGLLEE